jgi:hypothetical protein
MMNFTSATPLANLRIITSGRDTHYTFDINGTGAVDTPVREYRISALGRYLIAPQSITVKRRLVGCDIHWKAPPGSRVVPLFVRSWIGIGEGYREQMTVTTQEQDTSSRLSDDGLRTHIQGIEEKLRPFDPLQKALKHIDTSKVENIVGICKDRIGGRSHLTISGDPAKQLDYMKKNATLNVPVKLARAQISEGLFELQGFDIGQYSPETTYPLVRVRHKGKAAACVLNDDQSVAFWLDDPKVIGYLQLFDYCLQNNRKMRESLGRCLTGSAVPMRLLFNQALEIDYGKARLPALYQEILDESDKTSHMAHSIKQSLNHHQLGVSLNSILHQDVDGGGVCTEISILQEMRALEPIRKRFPEVFNAVTQRAALSDAGQFYLLDSISGVDHEA